MSGQGLTPPRAILIYSDSLTVYSTVTMPTAVVYKVTGLCVMVVSSHIVDNIFGVTTQVKTLGGARRWSGNGLAVVWQSWSGNGLSTKLSKY